jgi:hypothetical protein
MNSAAQTALTENAQILLARVTRTGDYTTTDEDATFELIDAGLVEGSFAQIDGEPTEYRLSLTA